MLDASFKYILITGEVDPILFNEVLRHVHIYNSYSRIHNSGV